MRRLMFTLSLIAVLSATPLRQAEAAHDFACAVGDPDEGTEIEVPDGGVGDDSDATIRASITSAPTTFTFLEITPPDPDRLLLRLRLTHGREWPPPRPEVRLLRRLADLQSFLC